MLSSVFLFPKGLTGYLALAIQKTKSEDTFTQLANDQQIEDAIMDDIVDNMNTKGDSQAIDHVD